MPDSLPSLEEKFPNRTHCFPQPMYVPERWFFSYPEKAIALIAEGQSWRGTPFRRGSIAKGPGGGTDCVGFDQCVYKAVGAIPAHINLQREKRRDFSRHCENDR